MCLACDNVTSCTMMDEMRKASVRDRIIAKDVVHHSTNIFRCGNAEGYVRKLETFILQND